MARGFISEDSLMNIADAIRSRVGGSNTYTPEEMAIEITNMPRVGEILNVAKVPGIHFQGSNFITFPVNRLDFTSVTSVENLFVNCYRLTSLNNVSFPNATNLAYGFCECTNLTNVDGLDAPKANNLKSIFDGCTKLVAVNSNFNAHNINRTASMFNGCINLISVNGLDTASVTDVDRMFANCDNLTTIGPLDFSSAALNIDTMFKLSLLLVLGKMENLGGFINLGKAYSITEIANNPEYRLVIRNSDNITHESLMNIITNLYNIADKGCNTQILNFGRTLSGKLNSDEIAIATNKGWTIN